MFEDRTTQENPLSGRGEYRADLILNMERERQHVEGTQTTRNSVSAAHKANDTVADQPTVLLVGGDDTALAQVSSVCKSLQTTLRRYSTPEFFNATALPPTGCIVTDRKDAVMRPEAVRTYALEKDSYLPAIYLWNDPPVATVVEYMREGAAAVLAKSSDHEELRKQFNASFATSEAGRADALRAHYIRQQLQTLTPREREVLGMATLGRTSREIAAQLERSVKTVELHRMNVLRKCGVRNTVELARELTKSEFLR